MKKPIWKNTLILAFSAFIVTLTPLGTARAEMVSEEVQEDAISPEGAADASSDNQELVIVKKKPAHAISHQLPARRVVRRQVVEEQEAEPVALQQEPAIEVQTSTRAQVAMPAAQPEKKSVGATVDSSIQNKMDGVRDQFEQALVKQLDKIKITVGDDEPKAEAPAQTTIVSDSIVNAHSAAPEKAGYMSIESAPAIAEDATDGESVAKKGDEESGKSAGIKVSPILGMTNISSSYYNISARYTAGVELEMEMDDSLAAVIGYSYSQHDISLGNANPFYTQSSMYGYGGSNYSTLQYNQNVFSLGMRLYLMPKTSKFRAFLGGGLGYNKGYVNYNNRYATTYQYNPFQNQTDYEVSSFLGILEAGAEVQVSKNISVGGLFKYDQVLSANQNQPLNNYAFINNGYGGQISDKAVVGGSIAKENFYSILGTVKVAF
ncbi:MAG: hypothetical protein ACXWQO_16145 [Bdellovibrionota bacterium]